MNLNAFLILTVVFWASFSCSCGKPDKENVMNSGQEPQNVPDSTDREDRTNQHRPMDDRPIEDRLIEDRLIEDRPIIVAFGDSLTAGRGVDPTQNYPSKLQAKIDSHGYRYRVLNAGVSGETSSQGLDRAKAYNYSPPAIAIVELGANDGLRGLPVENTRRNLAAIISRFQSLGAKVILAGMEVPPNYGPQYVSSFREVFPSVAEEYNTALIPFFLEGVGGYSHLNQDDGIHPTAEGYDIIVENVWKVLEPLLQK